MNFGKFSMLKTIRHNENLIWRNEQVLNLKIFFFNIVGIYIVFSNIFEIPVEGPEEVEI